MIQFLLNHQLINIDKVAPSLSILNYLRTTLALTRTKEGCAAGDCGACTVSLGELVNGDICYKAINACITPLGSLHGKQLITVEHLRQGAELHQIQSAMVDCNGSQCGFCTPGIVMSLFCWQQGLTIGSTREGTPGNVAERHSLDTALSGNLCRCTGYQPILRAAEQISKNITSDVFALKKQSVIDALKTVHKGPQGYLEYSNSHFFIPLSKSELTYLLLQYPNALLVAGATDLGLAFSQELKTPNQLIYTGNVKEMLVCDDSTTKVVIGGAVTYSTVQPILAAHFPAFAKLLNRLGSLQIRNQGTLGGNVANASPIGDTPPVLLALGGHVSLASAGQARQVPINQFFTAYRKTQMVAGEFIESICFPKLEADETLKVYKISKRFDDDISAVCIAIWLKMDGNNIVNVRIGCGGMAATPARAYKTENALKGKQFSEKSIDAACQALSIEFSPLSDVRASAAYRIAVAGQLLTRALLEFQGVTNIDLFASHQADVISGGLL